MKERSLDWDLMFVATTLITADEEREDEVEVENLVRKAVRPNSPEAPSLTENTTLLN